MNAFMVAVLGSVLFWIGFFAISLFIGTLIFRKIAPHGYNFLIAGTLTHPDYFNSFSEGKEDIDGPERFLFLTLMLIVCYLFWPFVLMSMTIGFIARHVLFGLFLNMIKFIDKIIPDIKIVRKEKDE